jgi:hypothetical protein
MLESFVVTQDQYLVTVVIMMVWYGIVMIIIWVQFWRFAINLVRYEITLTV